MALLLKITICIIYFIHCSTQGIAGETTTDSTPANDSNETVPQDLYVIKTIVYEIGILTDAGNDTDESSFNETHETVDVSFFDPANNGSSIDLSKIPLPVQTNVSGISVTGLLPAESLLNQTQNPVLPKKQVTVTQNISTTNPDRGAEIISNLPEVLGLTQHQNKNKKNE